jgi:D-tyrosyl-tRNA(Tyr) deacylase
MIAVVQRVTSARVLVESPAHDNRIDEGLLVLLGVEQGDEPADATWTARKLANLRIFADDEGRMNRSVIDCGGAMLVVSQFTLSGDCSRGNRPSFVDAAEPELGQRLYESVIEHLRSQHGLPVSTGVFGASMQVTLVNDGPVTIILRSRS